MADYRSKFTGAQVEARLEQVSTNTEDIEQLQTGKQDALQSGTNIKTVNGESVLGSGNISIPAGQTPDISIGTVTTGAAGSQAAATITGTPAAPVLNLTIPKGDTGADGATGATGPQGNTGSSVDYPYELVNNLTTDDATKGLSAAQGVVLEGEISQLEAEVGANMVRETFAMTAGKVTLTMSHTFTGGSTVYFRIVSNGVLATGTGYTLRFMNGGSVLSSIVVSPDVIYKFVLDASCTKIAIYVGSTQFTTAGNAYLEYAEEGMFYMGKQITELLSNVGETPATSLFSGGSLVNADSFRDGITLNSSGAETYAATGSVSDFISVTPSTMLVLSREANNSFIVGIYEYTSAKAFISRENSYAALLSLTLSANTAYIRISVTNTYKGSVYIYNSSNLFLPEIVKNGEFSGVLSSAGKRVSELGQNEGNGNLLSWDDCIYRMAVDFGNSTIGYNVNYCLSRKIPVVAGGRYLINVGCAVFNANDELITVWNSSSGGPFIAGTNASYIRASAKPADFGTSYIYFAREIPLTAVSYEQYTGREYIPSNKLNLPFIRDYCNYDRAKGFFSGKKLAVDGDSITHDQGGYNYWQFVLQNNLGMNMEPTSFVYDGTTYTIGSRGIAGSRIAVGEENNTKPYCIVLRYEELPADADLVVIAGGTNDWAHDGVQLGTMSDNTNVTFYGALHILCRGLIQRYPSGHIVFMTPIKRGTLGDTNANGNTLEQFANAIIEVCGYYGIPVCDMFHNCTMNPSIPEQQTIYFLDDTHPNTTGQRRMGNLVSGFIGSLV